ncbi:MAG: hypothetical protein Q9167_005327 [Letrouitia subvulpina]
MKTINDPSGIALRVNPPSSLSPKLCQLCRPLGDWFVSNWISAAEPRLNTYNHHLSWHALSESASGSCHFCYQLALEAEDRFMGGTLAYKIKNEKSTAFIVEVDSDSAKVFVRCDNLEWCVLNVNVMPDDPMAQHGMPILSKQDSISDAVLASTITHVRKWLTDCSTTHAECRIKSKFVPTRLIDVGSLGGSDDLRLLDTRQSRIISDADFKYATLSHCWGETKHIATTIDTLEHHKAGIKFSELNQTFRDAVLVTRALGIRYLWIDSLCIIQGGEGSESDWQRESSLMGSIYSGGAINIAADAAEDGDQGFLSKKTPSSFPYTLSNGKSNGMLYMKTSSRKRWTEYNGNLRRRAWVFQEYILSVCSIRYNTYSTMWECRCRSHYDSDVLLEENQFRQDNRALKNLPLELSTVSPSSPASNNSNVMTLWWNLVNEYSKKELTKETDILPALSGLASLFHTATGGDQYLAGIWRRDLPAALQWLTETPAWRSKTYHAPTWSWAACRKSCPATYRMLTPGQSKVKVLDVGVTVDGENPFGRVSDGFLKLEGRILGATCERLSLQPPMVEVFVERDKRQGRRSISRIYYDGEIGAMPPVWCLRLCVWPSGMQGEDLLTTGVLVLEEDKRENVFRRLGYEYRPMSDSDWDEATKKIMILK